MIHFTSDQHFYHKNIIKYSKRPFKTVDEMNRAIITNWNRAVRPDDLIYVLGDFAFASKGKIRNLLENLKGKKVLIIGNHDTTHKTSSWVKLGFDRATKGESINLSGMKIELNHYPIQGRKGWTIHGHIHNRWRVHEKCINVGVDVWKFKPVPMKMISNIINERIEVNNDGCHYGQVRDEGDFYDVTT